MLLSHLRQRHLWLQLWHTRGIMRRYFVVNGFDGALTMLGVITGFYLSASGELEAVIAACLGAAVALGVSGVSSAYLSERAERQRALSELEQAMVADLSSSAAASAARLQALLVAIVNGLAPFLISLVIIVPLWLARAGVGLPLSPLMSSIITAFGVIFGLGLFLGHVAGSSWLWSGIKALLIAVVTVALIRLVGV